MSDGRFTKYVLNIDSPAAAGGDCEGGGGGGAPDVAASIDVQTSRVDGENPGSSGNNQAVTNLTSAVTTALAGVNNLDIIVDGGAASTTDIDAATTHVSGNLVGRLSNMSKLRENWIDGKVAGFGNWDQGNTTLDDQLGLWLASIVDSSESLFDDSGGVAEPYYLKNIDSYLANSTSRLDGLVSVKTYSNSGTLETAKPAVSHSGSYALAETPKTLFLSDGSTWQAQGGGTGFAANTAVPSTLSLAFAENQTTGTLDVTNTADRPGAFALGSISGSFSGAIVSGYGDGTDYLVPSGSNTTIRITATGLAAQTGSIAIRSTSGDYSIAVTSNVTYMPLALSAVAAYDFARMYVDGDYADGDTVSTLYDKSGNSRNGSLVGTLTFDADAFGSAGQAGCSTISSNSNYFIASSGITTALASSGVIEFWTVTKHSNNGGRGAIIDLRGADAGYEHHPFSNGVFYSGMGSTSRITGANVGTWASGKVLRWRQSADSDTLHIRNMTDGIDIINTANTYTGFANATRRIGNNAGNYYYNGQIGALFFFDRWLDSGEAASLESYIAAAYGL